MTNLKLTEIEKNEGILRVFLKDTLKELMAAICAESGSLFLFDAYNKELVLNSFFNPHNLQLSGVRQKIGEGICGKIAAIKEPTLVKDIGADRRFAKNGFSHYKSKSFISIPLTNSQGALLGLINLTDKTDNRCFTEKDMEIALTISQYACLSYEHMVNSIVLMREKETLDRQKTLIEKYASVGKLAAGIVHEINNPLDGVIRYINILFEQTEHNTAGREYLSEVKNGLGRIAGITKSLLEFSSQINFNSSATKRFSHIHGLIDESIDLLSDRRNGRITVEKKYSHGLPRILDFGLFHVFINLIKNAFDAMPGGGTLEITTHKNDETIEITFKDTGSGISNEIIERIFDPFFTTKSAGQGTGLGLAISKEIIAKYNGSIKAQNLPQKGSRFTVAIPNKFLENV